MAPLKSKAQSAQLTGSLAETRAERSNIVGTLVTSVTKKTSPIPAVGSWVIELITIDGILNIVATSNGLSSMPVRLPHSATTFDNNLITGLVIVIAAGVAGHRSRIEVLDSASVGVVEVDNSQSALYVGNGMKVIQLRADNLAVQPTTDLVYSFDARGFNTVAFHANIISTAGTGSLTGDIKLYGGILPDASSPTLLGSSNLQYTQPLGSDAIFTDWSTAISRRSGRSWPIGYPYMGLRVKCTGTDKTDAGLWAILSTNGWGK